jgi:type IV secretory pathway VirB10-like protein
MADNTPGTTPITDHRVSPRGVLPRNAQTWLLIAVAVGIIGIIVLTGHHEPTARAATFSSTAASSPSPDHLRDYQDRLRVLDQRARQQAMAEPAPQVRAEQTPVPTSPALAYGERSVPPPTSDPLTVERQRREYESLFAANVVVSRRPDAQRLMTGESVATRRRAGSPDGALPPPPTIDDVADAVVRATSRLTPSPPPPTIAALTPEPSAQVGADTSSSATPRALQLRPATTPPISSTGPLHPVLEGTVIDAVLTNRLDGSSAGPVNCLVTNAVWSHDGRYVLVPAGARVLGETKPVQNFGETRLAVSFNRLVMPDGRTYRLDQFMGLNDIGDAGLRDQVNQHYKSTFGASAAVGLVSGFAQYLATAGFNRGNGDRTVIVTGGVSDAAAQSTAQVMNRYLNRPPNITIREGHRIKVYVTSDFQLPAYEAPDAGGTLLADVR